MTIREDYFKRESLFGLVKQLYPICRSITGDGVRNTLAIVKELIPLQIHEVPTGTEVFDWKIPKEWNIKEAWIKNSNGEKVVNFADSNLHVLSYSRPIDKKISLEELKQNLFTLPEQPEVIPHKTSYFKENWGFCISQNQLLNLQEDTYHVYIDSSLRKGSLTYGELYLEGNSEREILISTHICHPSLCNDNLSGISVAAHLAEILTGKPRLNYSYRFLFIPATIGSISWLALNRSKLENIEHGLVLSCLGDPGKTMTFKKSRDEDAEINKIVEKVLIDSGILYEIRDFAPNGYDERQYCSPGLNLPVGLLMRTPYGEFPEYHTSADNLDFIRAESLSGSLTILEDIIYIVENNGNYLNQNPYCEPNLTSRGLYETIGGRTQSNDVQIAVQWVLNFSDGKHSLLDISRRSGLKFKMIKKAADMLIEKGLLQPAH